MTATQTPALFAPLVADPEHTRAIRRLARRGGAVRIMDYAPDPVVWRVVWADTRERVGLYVPATGAWIEEGGAVLVVPLAKLPTVALGALPAGRVKRPKRVPAAAPTLFAEPTTEAGA